MKSRARLHSDQLTLADIPCGMRVRILNMDELPVERQDHLLAYGLAPGRWVGILQHRPAIVAQVDYTELALEPDDARRILVEEPMPVGGFRHFKRRAARRRRHLRRGLFGRRGRRHHFQFLEKFLRGEDK